MVSKPGTAGMSWAVVTFGFDNSSKPLRDICDRRKERCVNNVNGAG